MSSVIGSCPPLVSFGHGKTIPHCNHQWSKSLIIGFFTWIRFLLFCLRNGTKETIQGRFDSDKIGDVSQLVQVCIAEIARCIVCRHVVWTKALSPHICLTSASRLPHICLTSASRLPHVCLTSASRLPQVCLKSACWLINLHCFSNI